MLAVTFNYRLNVLGKEASLPPPLVHPSIMHWPDVAPDCADRNQWPPLTLAPGRLRGHQASHFPSNPSTDGPSKRPATR